VRWGRIRDQAPSAPTTKSNSSPSWDWDRVSKFSTHLQGDAGDGEIEISLCDHLMVSGGIEERSRDVRLFLEISGRLPSLPSS